jgi:hypothetical protein
MLAPWAIEEMRAAKLEDKRLNDRLTKLLSALGERPTVSIPAACGGYAETTAAYRFFDNERTTPGRILESHYECTQQRMAAHSTVLLVQDTSELDVTRPRQQIVGAGPVDGSARRGAFIHPLEAFTPDGTPLGAVWVKMWAREEPQETSETDKRPSDRTPIEEKESFRWVEGFRQAQVVAQALPQVTCVCVADSEGDIYELFAEPRGETAAHWLVRACQTDRLVESQDAATAADTRHLYDRAVAAPVLFTKEITVRGRDEPRLACDKRGRRQPRQGRTAQVEVRAATVTLQPPWRFDRHLPPVTINVVLVREIDPPADDVPVEWLLLTTLPIDSAERVREIVQYYTVRFMIEVLFRVLKSGCRVEERRFEHLDRLLPCVAVYLIVAWRTLMLCRLGRSCPDLDCEAVFEPAEWKAVWMVIHREAPPAVPPRLAEMIKLIAQLGGYVNRPNRKDPPGPQTVWLGLQRMRDLAWAWNTFGPGQNPQLGTCGTAAGDV